jgi:hypothetical protein
MSLDDLLLVIIIAGIGLSGTYLRAELVLHRRLTALERRRKVLQRELHKIVPPEQHDMPRQPRAYPSPTQTNVFPAMRVLARFLRIFVQERNIHWLVSHMTALERGAKHGSRHAS